jgi:hypothetical protein
VNGLRFHPALVVVDWTGVGVADGERPAAVDVRSFSALASSRVSAIASAAHAAAIVAAWGR